MLCEAGSLAVGNASIAAALLEVQEANSLMGLVVNYVGIKENMQTRARFEQDVLGGENASETHCRVQGVRLVSGSRQACQSCQSCQRQQAAHTG